MPGTPHRRHVRSLVGAGVLAAYLLLPHQSLLQNFRWPESAQHAEKLVQAFSEGGWKDIGFADDFGLALVIAFARLIENPLRLLVPFLALRSDQVFHGVWLAIHFSFLLLMYRLCVRLFGALRGALVAALVLCLPATADLIFSYDVYAFPFYGALCLLGIYAELALRQDGRPGRARLLILSIGFAFTLFMRSSHWVLLPLLPLLLAYEKVRDRRAQGVAWTAVAMATICSLGSLAVFKAPQLVFPRTQHVLWHSMHAGLFEFGGYADSEWRVYPGFIYGVDPPGAQSFARWDDAIQFNFARARDPSAEIYSDRYEAILRTDYLRLLREHPFDFLSLFLVRFLRVLMFAPFQSYASSGALMAYSAWDYGLSALAWIGLGYVLIKAAKIGEEWRLARLFLWLAAGLALPPVLVHSGYLIYNWPAQTILLILCVSGLLKIRAVWSQ